MKRRGNIEGESLRLSLPALPANVALVRSAVEERAESYGLSETVVADLKTVVSEACANVVLHAYAGIDPGPVEVEMSRRPSAIRIVVRDRGLGIGPKARSTGLSLKMGLALIGAISSCFQLRSARDRGTELSMDLSLPSDD